MNKFIYPNWDAPKHIKSIVTTRYGGVSLPPYASFNLGLHVNDDKQNVRANRQILQQVLPNEPLWLKQNHTNNIYIVGISTGDLSQDEYDAIISYQSNQVCVILTADCLPILLTNCTGDFTAAIHAGWRGLYNNIISKTIKTINSPSKEIIAYIGPSICTNCFIIKEDLVAKFNQLESSYQQFFTQANALDWQGDLVSIAILQLNEMGIPKSNIYLSRECTKCNHELYYSYRHNPTTGRIASLIWQDINC